MNISVTTTTGGIVYLTDAFIAGNGVAGDVGGVTIRVADCDIASVVQYVGKHGIKYARGA